jgi:hypothetical protein
VAVERISVVLDIDVRLLVRVGCDRRKCVTLGGLRGVMGSGGAYDAGAGDEGPTDDDELLAAFGLSSLVLRCRILEPEDAWS